jgi:hypothetical protein
MGNKEKGKNLMKKGESEEVKENWSEKSKISVKGVQVKAKIVHELQI